MSHKPTIDDGRTVFLCGIIADIRQVTGVGDKPMLSELAAAIKASIQARVDEAIRKERARTLRVGAECYKAGSDDAQNYDWGQRMNYESAADAAEHFLQLDIINENVARPEKSEPFTTQKG
jgi:hypothetical protein